MEEQVTEKTPRATQYALQDQRVADFITESAREIAQIRTDSALGEKMAPRGYGRGKLSEGETCATKAQGSFNVRQQKLGKKEHASDESESAEIDARDLAHDLRETIRARFPGSADRVALGVVGRLPKDGETFITTVRATIEAARKAPYASALAAMGYDAAGLDRVEAALARFATARNAHAQSTREAIAATATRDQDYKELRAYMTALRRIRKLAER